MANISGDRRRHGRVACTQTDDVVGVEDLAAIPGPGVTVEIDDIVLRQAEGRGDCITVAQVPSDCGCGVGQCAGRTIHVLARLQARTLARLWIVLGELGRRDAAPLRQGRTAVPINDLDVGTGGPRGEGPSRGRFLARGRGGVGAGDVDIGGGCEQGRHQRDDARDVLDEREGQALRLRPMRRGRPGR